MLTTREQFDVRIENAVEHVQTNMYFEEAYESLIRMWTVCRESEFKFLADMPVSQGRQWVRTAMTEYIDKHQENPDEYPVCGGLSMVRRIRSDRKARNKLAKARANEKKQACC